MEKRYPPLSGKVSDCNVDCRKAADTTESFPAKRESWVYVLCIWEKHYPVYRESEISPVKQARSGYTEKLFVSYERSVTLSHYFHNKARSRL